MLVNRYAGPLRGHQEERIWRFDTKPSKVYIAASLKAQFQAALLALEMQDVGLTVTSSWIRNDFSKKPLSPERAWLDYESKWGAKDYEDVMAADTLVLLSDEESSSGGFYVELGIFLGAGKSNILVVGKRKNVFFYLADIRLICDVRDVMKFMLDPIHGDAVAFLECNDVPHELEKDIPF